MAAVKAQVSSEGLTGKGPTSDLMYIVVGKIQFL